MPTNHSINHHIGRESEAFCYKNTLVEEQDCNFDNSFRGKTEERVSIYNLNDMSISVLRIRNSITFNNIVAFVLVISSCGVPIALLATPMIELIP